MDVADGVGLQFVLVCPDDYSSESSERFFVFRREKGQGFTFTADTRCTTTTMDVDLCVEGTLIVEDSLDVGDIKATSGYIRAD